MNHPFQRFRWEHDYSAANWDHTHMRQCRPRLPHILTMLDQSQPEERVGAGRGVHHSVRVSPTSHSCSSLPPSLQTRHRLPLISPLDATWWDRTQSGSVDPSVPPPLVDRKTRLKTLPSLVVRTWSVTRQTVRWNVRVHFGVRDFLGGRNTRLVQ